MDHRGQDHKVGRPTVLTEVGAEWCKIVRIAHDLAVAVVEVIIQLLMIII